MNTTGYKLFAQLCENIMFEDSSTMNLINGLPGGQQVVKYLHSQQGLGHAQDYKQIAKIAWSELKDAYRGAWVIMQYKNGVGAIKQLNGTYYAVASSGEAPVAFQDGRGGNVMDFLKGKLGGNPIKLWVGRETGTTKDLKQKRLKSKQELEKTTTISPEALATKFKPLWVKAMTVAIADIKGHVSNQIKNDAFEKAERKLGQLKRLNDALLSLESDKSTKPDFLNAAIGTAVTMSASHYYPDQTGNITRSYSSGLVPDSQEGVQQLLKDISAGDQAKLGTVLSFFKRALITG
jgi:hypothetical protein